MPGDEQDKAGVLAPPPLIYLVALVFGLLLNRRSPTTFLPRTIARLLGWPLLGGGVLLAGWFEWAMRRADTPANPYKPVSHIATEGPFRYTRNPAYLFDDDDVYGHRQPRERVVGHHSSAGRAAGDPAWRHRARGALFGAQVR